MIVGIGCDLVNIRRVEQELARGEWLEQHGVFTPHEIRGSASAADQGRYYALCFAAKEAVLKALGISLSDLALFREVEVTLDRTNEPSVVLNGRLKAEYEYLGVRNIRLSVTNHRKLAGAMVVLES